MSEGWVVLTTGSLDHGMSVSWPVCVSLHTWVVFFGFACVNFLPGWLDVVITDWLVRSNRGGLRRCRPRIAATGMCSGGVCWLLP
jgi:hypothetical protein